MAAKTLATYISELSAGTSIGAGDKVPVLESSAMVYFDGAALGGGITALTGEVTASGTGSVVATIATGLSATKIADGSISNTEFQYLNGVTSAIQTQLDAKVDENGAIVAATKTKITYDTKGLVTAGADATTADIADSLDRRYVTDAQLVVIGNTSGSNTGDQTNITGNAGTVTVADAGGDTTTWVLLGTAQTGSLAPATDAGLTYNATTNALTATTFIGALTGNADTVTGFSGTSSGTNTGDQTITNSSDATSHTVTLSASGGSVQLVEGSGITLTTTGTGSAGIVTIAASGGAGDITNGGNTTGAAVTIGTNDDFGLNLETAGVTRMAITGAASTGGAVTITNVTTNTNTVQDVLTLQTNSTGTAAASFGGGILFQGESSTTDNQEMARIASYWTTATHASRTSNLKIQLTNSAGALGGSSGHFIFNPGNLDIYNAAGNASLSIYHNQIIPSGNFSLVNSVGTLTLTASAANTAAVLLGATTNNVATSATLGNTSFTTTSGDKYDFRVSGSYAPTSGTGTFRNLYFNGTINQTGGANGNTGAIYIAPTLTAVGGTYYAIDIAANSASAKGIYQSGASTTNNFVGATGFGSTSAPNAAAIVEMTSTTKGFLPPRMTGAERDAIASPVAGLTIYNTTTNKLNVYTTAWEAVTSA